MMRHEWHRGCGSLLLLMLFSCPRGTSLVGPGWPALRGQMMDEQTHQTADEQSAQWDRRYVVHIEHSAAEYEPRLVTAGDGAWLTMADGTRLLDMHGQYMCVGMGHGHPKLREALHKAIDGLDFVCELFTHEAKGRAARLLIEDTMDGSDWAGAAKFVSSGSEAVEAALLMARLYTNRPTIITRQGAYHGWTPGAVGATTLPYLRDVFTDTVSGEVRHVPTPHPDYPAAPAALSDERAEDGRLACVAETERVIRAVGVEKVAAIITEIYHGAGGFLVPDGYVQQIREMTKRLGILWIDDEVIAGAGRTGRWWAFQHYGVEPDILCTAKGISSSSVPAGAVIISKQIADWFGRGRWAAVSTFSGHPLATAAIAANIEIMLEEHVVEHVAEVGVYFGGRLTELAKRHACAASVSGRGLAWSVELVKDPATGQRWIPQDRWLTPSRDGTPGFWPGRFVAEECEKHGVLLLNFLPNTVTIAPPLKITKEELDLAIEALDKAFAELNKKVVS
jgi:taurine--2-oxoglutarate transaminase